jgi:long-subunit acyl-CoA synthetase (AMP-forming)
MNQFRTRQDVAAIEAEMPWADRDIGRTMHAFLSRAAKAHGLRPAVTFQLTSGAKDRAQTMTWADLLDQVTQTANLLRALGVGPHDVVAYVLPNALETVVTLLAGAVAGIARLTRCSTPPRLQRFCAKPRRRSSSPSNPFHVPIWRKR